MELLQHICSADRLIHLDVFVPPGPAKAKLVFREQLGWDAALTKNLNCWIDRGSLADDPPFRVAMGSRRTLQTVTIRKLFGDKWTCAPRFSEERGTKWFTDLAGGLIRYHLSTTVTVIGLHRLERCFTERQLAGLAYFLDRWHHAVSQGRAGPFMDRLRFGGGNVELTAQELELLKCVLAGEPYDAFMRRERLSRSRVNQIAHRTAGKFACDDMRALIARFIPACRGRLN